MTQCVFLFLLWIQYVIPLLLDLTLKRLFTSSLHSDTICDLGGVNELANYGEYSGAPSEQQTYDYAKTILSLMTREKHPDGTAWHSVISNYTVTRIPIYNMYTGGILGKPFASLCITLCITYVLLFKVKLNNGNFNNFFSPFLKMCIHLFCTFCVYSS